jgi:hypothetical protein
MPKEGFTDEQIALLQPEERAGLDELQAEESEGMTLDEQLAAEEAGTLKVEPPQPGNIPAPSAEPEHAPAPAPASPPAPSAPSPGDTDPPAPKAADPAPAPVPAAQPTAQPQRAAPLPDWKAPADVDKQIADLNAKRDKLAQDVDDGEISTVDWRKQDREIDAQIRELEKTQLKAEISSGARSAATVENWRSDVGTFLAQHPEFKDGPRYDALDIELRRLQTAAVTAGGNQFDPALLQQAFDKVSSAFGATAPAPKPNDPPAPLPGNPAPAPTLRTMPASDATPTRHDGEFGELERLSGEEYDAALAALPADKRERYLAGG